jgi:aryl-alcohol dehydrogenase-like predicted oxidoreductase
MFWEPNYQTLTEFMGRMSPGDRAGIHIIAGTFEADGRRIRADAERVLRMLRIDRITLFLLFWTQSWERITPEIMQTLSSLKTTGKVAMFSLSTHNRPLALEAMEQGWNPLMVRHSAAHRGAEDMVFARAVQTGSSLITFNNTCYGRLLKPPRTTAPPTGSDCYRYCLMQPGVRACLSAPATLEQLEENLKALRDPELPPDRLAALLAHGTALYREETIFRKLVRSL